MTFFRAFGVKLCIVQNLLPSIGRIKGCPTGVIVMQSDAQPADILEHLQGDESEVRAFISSCHFNKFVPQVAELMLELGQSMFNIELANRP